MGGRGLVLSGGGPVGIAWEAGVLAGLAETDPGVVHADVIVGTSAGSVVGAQLALGVSPARLMEQQRRPSERAQTGAQSPRPAPDGVPDELIEALLGGGDDPEATRRRLGELAVSADTVGEQDFVASFGPRLADAAWPQSLMCTAVDTADGRFVAFDAAAGVPLVLAVAASCAVPGIYPPVTIDGRRYMDGGVRSMTSADLAVGCDHVLVLTLLAPAGPEGASDPLTARQEDELARLRKAGATVRVIAPDDESRRRMGPDLMDFSRRAEAAEAGVAQGRAPASETAG